MLSHFHHHHSVRLSDEHWSGGKGGVKKEKGVGSKSPIKQQLSQAQVMINGLYSPDLEKKGELWGKGGRGVYRWEFSTHYKAQ